MKIYKKMLCFLNCSIFFYLIRGGAPCSLEKNLHERIVSLVKSNPGQLSIEEYELIAQTIINRKPCNVLVFGVGRDSTLWMDLNINGNTVFLEDNINWFNFAKKQNSKIICYLVKYDTKLDQWFKLLNKPELLQLVLPKPIRHKKWDVIFVDAPRGQEGNDPGRMKSIYIASQLAKKKKTVDIFVHDCDRVIERAFCNKFLSRYILVKTVKKLRHYHKI